MKITTVIVGGIYKAGFIPHVSIYCTIFFRNSMQYWEYVNFSDSCFPIFCISFSYWSKQKRKIQTEWLFRQNNLSTLSWSLPPTPWKMAHTYSTNDLILMNLTLNLYNQPWKFTRPKWQSHEVLNKIASRDTGVSVIFLNFPYSVDINDNHKFIYIMALTFCY